MGDGEHNEGEAVNMKAFEAIGLVVCVSVAVAVLSLLLAFPFMWAWNYVMPNVFGLPTVGWLGSFCLLWVAHQVLPSRVIKQ